MHSPATSTNPFASMKEIKLKDHATELSIMTIPQANMGYAFLFDNNFISLNQVENNTGTVIAFLNIEEASLPL